MTREEKIAELINIRDNFNYTLAPREVFDDAIKALEQEPTIEEEYECIYIGNGAYEKRSKMKSEPTTKNDVVPRKVVERIIKSSRTQEQMLSMLNSIQSVTPQEPRKGHWIGHREHCENLGVMPSGLGAYEWCSNCDCGIDVREWHRNHYNYCPNCGADMSEVEE